MVRIAALLAIAAVGMTIGAGAAYGKATAVRISAPAKVKADGELRVRIRTRLASPFRVELQQQRRRGWRTVSRRFVARGSTAELTWRVRSPLPYLTLRAVVRSGHRTATSTANRVRIARSTQALRPGEIVAAPAPDEAGRIRYRGAVAVAPGDIVAAPSGPQTPDGFLGLVTSVSRSGGLTEVQTQPTTLLAAVPSGSIDVESSSGSSATSSASQRPVSHVIKCSKGGEIKVEGAVSVAPTVSLHAKWSLFHGVTAAQFEAGLKMNGDLTASAQAAASCKVGPVTLAQWDLPPIDVQVGPVPVVFIPVVKIVMEGDGSVSAQVSTGLHGTVSATGGLAYENGAVHPIGGVTHTFTFDAPVPTAKAHLGGEIGPTVSLLLYGVAGPEVDLRAGLSLDADTAANPWWKLTAPIDVGATLAVPALGLDTGRKSIYHKSFLLAQSSGPFGPPAAAPPAAAPAPAGIVFVGSPATGPAPATLGPYAMHQFAPDPQEFEEVQGVDGPTGRLNFSIPLLHLLAPEESGWRTWSNGYVGDVYASQLEPAVTLYPPAGTKAFYLYAEPDEFAIFDITVKTQDGTTSGVVPVFGEAGAAFFGFYSTGGATIQNVTVECPEDDFAVGEFGISSG
jgi:hypothetical protein